MERTCERVPKMAVIVKGLVLSYMITGASLLILALLLLKFQFSPENIDAGITTVYVISCLAGGFFAGKQVTQQKFFWGMVLGLIYFLFLVLLSVFSETGLTSGWKDVVLSFVLCLGSGMLGGMIA